MKASLVVPALAFFIGPLVIVAADKAEHHPYTDSVEVGANGQSIRHVRPKDDDERRFLNETFLAANETEASDVGEFLIVGGREAARGAYPYFVDVFGTPGAPLICGGSLIAPRVVLTAQHCNLENGAITTAPTFVGSQVRVGAFDADGTADGSRLVTVIDQRSHPQFRDIAGLQNDFLLLLLAESVDIEDKSPKLRLSNLDSDISPGTTQTVIGLGLLSSGGAQATTLQEVNVQTISDNQCLENYVSSTVLTPFPGITFCAGVPQGGQDSCQVRLIRKLCLHNIGASTVLLTSQLYLFTNLTHFRETQGVLLFL
jgi:secreted trypsin-like serine protease